MTTSSLVSISLPLLQTNKILITANDSTTVNAVAQPHSEECYVVVLAMQHWRPSYLWGETLCVRTVADLAALRYFVLDAKTR